MKRLFISALLLVAGAYSALAADSITARMGLIKPSIGSTGWGEKLLKDYDILDTSAAIQGASNIFTATNLFSGVVTATNATNQFGGASFKFADGTVITSTSGIGGGVSTATVVTGATINTVLYANGSGVVSSLASFGFNGSILTVPNGTFSGIVRLSSTTELATLQFGDSQNNIKVSPGFDGILFTYKNATNLIMGQNYVQFSQPVRAPAGTQIAPAFVSSSDPTNGIFFPASGAVGFTNGTVAYATFTLAGSSVTGTFQASTVTATAGFVAPDGSASSAGYRFVGAPGDGLFNSVSDVFVAAGGSSRIRFGSTISAAVNFYVPNGSAASPSLGFSNDTASGFYLVNTGLLGIAANGVQAVQVSSNGITIPGTGASGTNTMFKVGNSSFSVLANNNIVINSSTMAWPSSNSSGVLTNNGSGTLTWGTAGGVPGGTNGTVQYNNGGTFDGISAITISSITNTLTATRETVTSSLTVTGTGVTGSNPIFAVGTSTLAALANGNLTMNGVTMSWPTASASGVLTNNGSGALSWAPASGLTAGTSNYMVKYDAAGTNITMANMLDNGSTIYFYAPVVFSTTGVSFIGSANNTLQFGVSSDTVVATLNTSSGTFYNVVMSSSGSQGSIWGSGTQLNLGVAANTSVFSIFSSSMTQTGAATGTRLWLENTSADAQGSGPYFFTSQNDGGTGSNAGLGGYRFGGADTVSQAVVSGGLYARSNQTWTGSAHGTDIQVLMAGSASTSLTEFMRFQGASSSLGRLFVNGVSGATTIGGAIVNVSSITPNTSGSALGIGGAYVLGSFPTSSMQAGTIIYSTTDNRFYRSTETAAAQGSWVTILDGAKWASVAASTVTNTTTETTLLSAGTSTTTFTANSWTVGKTIKITLRGIISTAASPGTHLFQVKFGSVVVASSTAVTPTSSISTQAWVLEGFLTCRSTGATGKFIFSGDFGFSSNNVRQSYTINQLENNLQSVDTTAAQTLNVTLTNGTQDVANILVTQTGLIEVAN